LAWYAWYWPASCSNASRRAALDSNRPAMKPGSASLSSRFAASALAYVRRHVTMCNDMCRYTVVTLLSHCCHTFVTLLLHCCYTVVTLLLHCVCVCTFQAVSSPIRSEAGSAAIVASFFRDLIEQMRN
jgi:hypothetical protein